MFSIRVVAVASALLILNLLRPAAARPSVQNANFATLSIAQRSQLLVRQVIARYLALSHQRRSSPGVSSISPELAKSKELVYVSSDYDLNIYSSAGKSLGVIAAPDGGDFGNGVAVD